MTTVKVEMKDFYLSIELLRKYLMSLKKKKQSNIIPKAMPFPDAADAIHNARTGLINKLEHVHTYNSFRRLFYMIDI
ncbi:hypothetical protein P7H16_12630 [Paenibacillus larvae]|nr:hypothetical protein [Paenibacillus larvae]MDT2247590.1 hypothetical protein [Paenibacillus larvae]MDT2254795.1 hypothetical protein [Paenibacillus larvae]MDT2276453.1 hypothetical protein [Paenibacillus larvae]MDT2293650.1 hypothetical protein [Paenibacillus larvae]